MVILTPYLWDTDEHRWTQINTDQMMIKALSSALKRKATPTTFLPRRTQRVERGKKQQKFFSP
jgi:hypothetical protein